MDSIDLAFKNSYNEAHECYSNHDLEKCIEKCQRLLEDPAMPRFHRMETLVLLGSTLGDWYEANECYVKADTPWCIVRRWHPVGESTSVDDAMEECRVEIAELKTALQEDYPQDYDVEEEAEAGVVALDAEVEEKKVPEEATQDEQEAVLNPDGKTLDISKEELR